MTDVSGRFEAEIVTADFDGSAVIFPTACCDAR